MASFPRSVSDLTAAWVEDLMRRWGALPSGSISELQIDSSGLEAGFFGDVARVRIKYGGGFDGGPSTMIAKFSPSDERAFDEGKRRGYYNREVAFYRDFAPTCGLRVPACYGAEYDPDGGGNLLLLEDLSGFRAGTEPSPSWRQDAEAIMKQMGAFNARWWGREAEISFPWLAASDEGAERFQEAFAKAWPAVEMLFGADIDPDALRQGARVAERVVDIKHPLGQLSVRFPALRPSQREPVLYRPGWANGRSPGLAALPERAGSL